MAYADDFFSPQDRCEICGAELEDEVVIQEFADGSLARLCPECAAGTALDDTFTDRPLPDEKPAKKRRGFRLRGGKSKPGLSDEAPFSDDEAFADESPFALGVGAGARESAGPEGQPVAAGPEHSVFDAQAFFTEPPAAAPQEAAPQAPTPRAAATADAPVDDAETTARIEGAAGADAPADDAETTARIQGAAVRPASPKGKAKAKAAAPAAAPAATPPAAPAVTPAGTAPPVPAPAAGAPATSGFPEPPASTTEDLLDKTRELLLPVTDLIVLQGEVQGALERLASSLERFAADLITDSQGKAEFINHRLQTLEQELDATRARLRETEALLPDMAALEAEAKVEPSLLPEEVQPVTIEALIAESRAAAEAARAAAPTAAPQAAEAAPVEETLAKAEAELGAPAEAAPETEAETEAEAAPEAEVTPIAEAEAGPAGTVAETSLGEGELPPSEPEEIAKITWTPQDLWPTEIESSAERAPEVEAAPAAEVEPAIQAASEFDAEPPFEGAPLTEAELAAHADRSAEAYLAAEPRTVPLPGFGPSTPSRATAPGRASTRLRATAPPADEAGESTGNFRINEVQAAQRYYNESTFVNRIRDVRRSLGKPKACVVRLAGETPRAIITIYWDIVWYQYLVDLRRDLPSTQPRVTLHREGMSLDEIPFEFKEKNATVNDDGRLDASELEVHLLSDPSALITEMSQEETQVLEDATEEIWNQHGTPEFKWDD